MVEQLTLDLGRKNRKIEERFNIFNAKNPEVLKKLEVLTGNLWRKGHAHFGIALIFERLRYEVLETNDPNSDFKLSNDYRAYYARLIMERNPAWKDVFTTRPLRSK